MSKNKVNLNVICLLSTLFICIFAASAPATIIGTSEHEDCLKVDQDLECEQAISLTVPVSYGLLNVFEATTVDPDPCRPLEQVVEFEITKHAIHPKSAPPQLQYPLRYFHTVPYYPHEEVIKAPYPVDGCPGCIDCAGAEYPTCGWTYQGGLKLPHSQGFCIIKSLWELERSGWSCSLFRGEEILGEQATIDNPFSTGHCMRLGELYFHGYEIGKYIKCYMVQTKLTKGSESHTFTLSPDSPLYYTKYDENYEGNFHFKAQLLGDMDPFSGALELDNYILYIPSTPEGAPGGGDYNHHMLLVPREEVSRDGSEPDKPGVSFKTFRMLGSDYKVSEAGDGLGNQLFHKHNLDLQKLAVNPNAETTYLVHGKKDFKDSMEFRTGMEKVLEYNITEINNSLVTLTMNVENIREITTESLGAIVEAYVKTFTSFSNEGTLIVTIKNVGDYKADFIVTVTEATMNILKGLPAKARVLDTQEEAELKFDVSTLYNLDTSNEFLVSLKGRHGKVYDSVMVRFDTKKHQSKYPWEFYEKNQASETSIADVDTIPPEITMYGPNTITLECGDTYVELGAEAIDDTDPNVEVLIGGDTVDSSTCGIYEVIYSATDSACNSAEVTRTVTVPPCNTVPLELSVSVSPSILWPPNHKMVKIIPTITVSGDQCGSGEVTLLSITSNEDDNGRGDGNTRGDILITDDGSIYLRAERSGPFCSRVYTITYQAVDDAGNVAVASATVTVPKRRSWLRW
jgi:hypothetical protein